MSDVDQIKTCAPALLIGRLAEHWLPPEDVPLSRWAEENIEIPEDDKARPGNYRNWPYMREILDVIGDNKHEKVTILKSARIGYTLGLGVAIGALAALNPTKIMLLMPTDEDATEIGVDQIEPIFNTSPALKGLLSRDRTGRNNLRNKTFIGGGSLKIRSGRAPRKLRRLDVRVLLVDEADGFEMTKEGDAIAIAEKRTLAKPGAKMVKGSTPTEEGVSTVGRDYKEGDMRIFEVPCPHCHKPSEIQWEAIEYKLDPTGNTVVDAQWRCPECHELVPERYKPSMINAGRWRKLRPEIKNHASFRINALSSLLPNATWLKVCQMWIEHDRGGPALRQVFVNTILGREWRTTINRVDAETLRSRVEPIGMVGVWDRSRSKIIVPEDVVAITVGTDVQDDRLESTVMGWTVKKQPMALGHVIHEGNTLEPEVWQALDQWHAGFDWRHPNGWRLRIDAMAVDSGGREGRTQVVYDWCAARLTRGIYAIKGDDGPNKRAFAKAKKVKGDVSLYIVGVDQMKTAVLDSIGRSPFPDPKTGEIDQVAMRFSDSLHDEFFEQLTNEVRRLRYVQGRPVIKFEVKKQGLAVEALDCCAYAFAVRHSVAFAAIDLAARAARRVTPADAGPVTVSKRTKLADLVKRTNG